MDHSSKAFDAAEEAVERSKGFDAWCWVALVAFASYFIAAIVPWLAQGAPVVGA